MPSELIPSYKYTNILPSVFFQQSVKEGSDAISRAENVCLPALGVHDNTVVILSKLALQPCDGELQASSAVGWP